MELLVLTLLMGSVSQQVRSLPSSPNQDFIGTLKTIHNGVRGDVYAAGNHTIVIHNFYFDGHARDAVFWAGESDNMDLIFDTVVMLPDGKFFSFFDNVPFLEAYNGETITLTLSDRINVQDLKFLTVWSKYKAKDLGYITFPGTTTKPTEKPATTLLQEVHASPHQVFLGTLKTIHNGVRGDVYAAGDHTIVIHDFYFDGHTRDAVFWAGESNNLEDLVDTVVLSPDGMFHNFSDDAPFLEAYNGETVTLTLPNRINVEDLKFLTVWSKYGARDLGFITFLS